MNIQLIGLFFTKLKYLYHQVLKSNRYILTKRLIRYIESDDCDLPATEKDSIKKFLKKSLVSQISYPFIKKYRYRVVSVLWDKTKSLYYVYHNKKRLYFKKGLSKAEVKNMYNGLCIEQDIKSPHSYFAFPVNYQLTDTVVDIGAAEGIWALDIAEKVKEIHLFECEEGWIEALQATFDPWKNKVHIVNKYVTDYTDEKNTTLDDYFAGINSLPTIIKVDIEGAESSCIKGASKMLSQHICHVFLCTYHNFSDFEILSKMMKNQHFEVEPSEGYMISVYSEPDYGCKDITKIFRKGLIYAYKFNNSIK
jgi:hypothetical protein